MKLKIVLISDNEQKLSVRPYTPPVLSLRSAEDPRRAEAGAYSQAGKKMIPQSAVVLFCSGRGTRFAASDRVPKVLALATIAGKTPLELLIRNTPEDISRIIITTAPGDTVIEDFLKLHKYFDRDPRQFVFVEQPQTITDSAEEVPAGTGKVVEKILNDPKIMQQLAGVQHLIMMDGEKTGYKLEAMLQMLGFHGENKNSLTVATYLPTPATAKDKKFAHIDLQKNIAYLGKHVPEELLDRFADHHLGGGVYIFDLKNTGGSVQPLRPLLEDKLGADGRKKIFWETPLISLIEAVAGQIGYFQIERGELGAGMKEREAVPKNITASSAEAIKVLNAKGWTVLNNTLVEMYDLSLSGLNADTVLANNSQLFIRGQISMGEGNKLSGILTFSPAKNKIVIGNANPQIKTVTLGGQVSIGSGNLISRTFLIADDPALYRQHIPDISGPFKAKKVDQLLTRLFDDRIYETKSKYQITVGNNCSLTRCLIIGNVRIGDNVDLEESIIINTSPEPLIINSGSSLYQYHSGRVAGIHDLTRESLGLIEFLRKFPLADDVHKVADYAYEEAVKPEEKLMQVLMGSTKFQLDNYNQNS
ncbi:MAG: hypothetical protein WC838_05315, partial [Candidatus Margulisiibacteriota bacterium]